MLNCISSVIIDRGWIFRQPKIFRWRVFGENNWKPTFFQRASVTLSPFSGLKSHVRLPNTSQAKDFESLVAFSFYLKLFFWFFHEILSDYILEKKWVFKQIFALSEVKRFQRASIWCVHLELKRRLSNKYSTGLWCKFWLPANFSHGPFAESCQSIGFFKTCRLFQRLSILFYKQRKINVNKVSWRSLDCPEKLSRTFWGTLGCG